MDMKKIVMSVALAMAALRCAFAGSCPVDLDISALGVSVEEVLIVRTVKGTTSTNSVTPATGGYQEAILADSVYLEAKLKPGYTNARFRCEQEGYGSTAASTVYVNSGSAVPFRSVDSVNLATSVEELLVDPMTFTLTFNPDGGTVAPTSATITYGATYGTLPTPTRTGYVFKGWQCGGKTWTGSETVATLESQTFTAAWEPITYTVKFDKNGGTGSMSNQTFTYDKEQTLSANAFTMADYKFSCWSNTVTGATYQDKAKVTNLTAVQGEVVTLSAVWVAKTYEIRYHRNYSSDLFTTQSITYGVTANLQATPTRAGYNCSGWAKSASATMQDFSGGAMVATGDFEFDENGVFDLYAVWKPFTYTVTFNANGGEGTMASMSRFYDDGAALSNCTFIREGYSFSGWSTTAAGAVEYSAGITTNLSDQDGRTLALYAVWTPITYTIAFDANDEKATGVMDSIPATYNVLQNLPACALTKDGYDCLGWALAPDGEVAYADCASVANLTTVEGAEIVLYAKWKPQSYTVVLDANGGGFVTGSGSPVVSNYQVTVDAPYGEFPVVTNGTAKLVFDSWRTPRGAVKTATDIVPAPSAGVTNLLARWVKDDPLARAVDSKLDFDISSENGKGEWKEVEDSTAEGGNSAHAQVTTSTFEDILKLTTQVVGPGTLTFQWKVLSDSVPNTSGDAYADWEYTPERFFFDINGSRQWGIAGTADKFIKFSAFSGEYPTQVTYPETNPIPSWIEETLRIDAAAGETNTLNWTFHCVEDTGIWGEAWVDNVRWVQDVVTVTIGEVPKHFTAKYVVAGVTNDVATATGKFTVAGGTTNVKIVYVADEGYEPESKEVVLADGGALETDLELLAEEIPDAPTPKAPETVTVTVASLPEHITALSYSFKTNGVEATGAVSGSSFEVPAEATDVEVQLVVEDGWTATPNTIAVSLASPSVAFDGVEIAPVPVPPVMVAVASMPEHVTALNYSFKTNGVTVTGAVSGGSFEVPAEATDVEVRLEVEDGYTATPNAIAVDLASPSVSFAGVTVAPVVVPVEMVTVKVPSVAHYTAQVVVDGVAQAVVNGQVEIEKGKTGVKVVYVAEVGYTPATKEIALGELTGDVEIPSEDLPPAPVLKQLTVTVPASEHYTIQAIVNGVAAPVANGKFTVDYGTANVVVVYVAEEGWEPAEKRITLANGAALVADAAVAESEKPVATEIPEPKPPMLEGSGTVKLPKKLTVGKKATWKATPDNGCVFMGWAATDAAGEQSLAQITAKKLAKTSLSAPVTQGMTVNSIVPVWKRMDEVVPAGSGALMTWCDDTQGKVSKSYYVKLGKKKSVRATAKKGYVFAGWYADPWFTTPFEFSDGKDYRKTSHTVLVNGNVHVFARFVPKTAAGDPIVGLTYVGLDGTAKASDVWTLGVPVEIPGVDFESASLPTITMKKLPKGTKWNSKKMMITGTPKKEGVYEAIITVKNASKTKAEFKVTITVAARP